MMHPRVARGNYFKGGGVGSPQMNNSFGEDEGFSAGGYYFGTEREAGGGGADLLNGGNPPMHRPMVRDLSGPSAQKFFPSNNNLGSLYGLPPGGRDFGRDNFNMSSMYGPGPQGMYGQQQQPRGLPQMPSLYGNNYGPSFYQNEDFAMQDGPVGFPQLGYFQSFSNPNGDSMYGGRDRFESNNMNISQFGGFDMEFEHARPMQNYQSFNVRDPGMGSTVFTPTNGGQRRGGSQNFGRRLLRPQPSAFNLEPVPGTQMPSMYGNLGVAASGSSMYAPQSSEERMPEINGGSSRRISSRSPSGFAPFGQVSKQNEQQKRMAVGKSMVNIDRQYMMFNDDSTDQPQQQQQQPQQQQQELPQQQQKSSSPDMSQVPRDKSTSLPQIQQESQERLRSPKETSTGTASRSQSIDNKSVQSAPVSAFNRDRPAQSTQSKPQQRLGNSLELRPEPPRKPQRSEPTPLPRIQHHRGSDPEKHRAGAPPPSSARRPSAISSREMEAGKKPDRSRPHREPEGNKRPHPPSQRQQQLSRPGPHAASQQNHSVGAAQQQRNQRMGSLNMPAALMRRRQYNGEERSPSPSDDDSRSSRSSSSGSGSSSISTSVSGSSSSSESPAVVEDTRDNRRPFTRTYQTNATSQFGIPVPRTSSVVNRVADATVVPLKDLDDDNRGFTSYHRPSNGRKGDPRDRQHSQQRRQRRHSDLAASDIAAFSYCENQNKLNDGNNYRAGDKNNSSTYIPPSIQNAHNGQQQEKQQALPAEYSQIQATAPVYDNSNVDVQRGQISEVVFPQSNDPMVQQQQQQQQLAMSQSNSVRDVWWAPLTAEWVNSPEWSPVTANPPSAFPAQ